MMKSCLFENDGRYAYGFSASGFFTLLNKNGEPLYDEVIPLVEKLGSHLIWIMLWLALILFFPYKILMAMVFVHLLFIGIHLTTLLLKGGIKPLIFPPLWIRLSRQLRKGKDLQLLQKHNLDKHPGLLMNLGLAQLERGLTDEGNQTLLLTKTILTK